MKKDITKAILLAIAANLAVWTFLILISEAGSVSVAHTRTTKAPTPPPLPKVPPVDPDDSFSRYLSTDIPPADGFDFPVGDADGDGDYTDKQTGKTHHGWHVSTHFCEWYTYGIHPAEDWNGDGGANSDLGQPVHAVAAGKVVFAKNCGQPSGCVVMIQHSYYENHLKRRIRSVYVHLAKMHVSAGQIVSRRQAIGEIGRDPLKRFFAHLHFELRLNETIKATFWPSAAKKSRDWIRKNYAAPSPFIRSHRELFVPPREKRLALVDSRSGRMRLYDSGRTLLQFPVGLGRGATADGSVAERGLPLGMYFVVAKHSLVLGNHLVKIAGGFRLALNYPNRFDVAREHDLGHISDSAAAEIGWAWKQRKPTAHILPAPAAVPGVEIEEWSNQAAGRFPCQLPAGKILLQRHDMRNAFDKIPLGSMVVIF